MEKKYHYPKKPGSSACPSDVQVEVSCDELGHGEEKMQGQTAGIPSLHEYLPTGTQSPAHSVLRYYLTASLTLKKDIRLGQNAESVHLRAKTCINWACTTHHVLCSGNTYIVSECVLYKIDLSLLLHL